MAQLLRRDLELEEALLRVDEDGVTVADEVARAGSETESGFAEAAME